MKNLNITRVQWKIWFLRGGGFTKNQYIRENCLKGGGVFGQFADLGRRGWRKRGLWCFWKGELIPQETLRNAHFLFLLFSNFTLPFQVLPTGEIEGRSPPTSQKSAHFPLLPYYTLHNKFLFPLPKANHSPLNKFFQVIT